MTNMQEKLRFDRRVVVHVANSLKLSRNPFVFHSSEGQSLRRFGHHAKERYIVEILGHPCAELCS